MSNLTCDPERELAMEFAFRFGYPTVDTFLASEQWQEVKAEWEAWCDR